jgi:hypothetical protein
MQHDPSPIEGAGSVDQRAGAGGVDEVQVTHFQVHVVGAFRIGHYRGEGGVQLFDGGEIDVTGEP